MVKAKTASIGKPLPDREREGSVISVTESMSKNSRRNSIRVILFRLTENIFLLSEISEKTWNEELSKPFLLKFQLRVRLGDSELIAKKFRICVDWWSSTRA